MFTGQFRARGNGNFLVERSSSSTVVYWKLCVIIQGQLWGVISMPIWQRCGCGFRGIGLSVTQPMYLEALGLAWQGLELVLRLAGWIMFQLEQAQVGLSIILCWSCKCIKLFFKVLKSLITKTGLSTLKSLTTKTKQAFQHFTI